MAMGRREGIDPRATGVLHGSGDPGSLPECLPILTCTPGSLPLLWERKIKISKKVTGVYRPCKALPIYYSYIQCP